MFGFVSSLEKRLQSGFTYIEVLLSAVATGMIMLALMGVMNTATNSSDLVSARNESTQQARFVLTRMVGMVAASNRLLLPLKDNPNSNWPEHIREQTMPASPPIGDSSFASAVLAVTLPHNIDYDQNGLSDADNDGDGRFDEDSAADNTNDGAAGILGIDDNGDGSIDDSTAATPASDNDEDDTENEDPSNGIDDDGDGSVDEDSKHDANDDGRAGIAGVDDDADGSIDEGSVNDDDEDGKVGEDWYDPVVYFLADGDLIERLPLPWDNNNDTVVTGADFNETVIAENVTRFRVERVVGNRSTELIDLTLELTDPGTGEVISLQTRVRLGGAL